MTQFQCEFPNCGKKDALTFHCNYCGGYFCAEHHLPESHNCPSIPKIAPFHVRPLEVESYKPSLISNPPINHYSKTKRWKKIAWILPLVIIIVLLLWVAYPFIQQAAKNPSIPSQTPTAAPIFSTPNTSSITPAPIVAATPALTTSYVEVDYQTVGWFYATPDGELYSSMYNYTYLVLNVTITNHGYSQVNVNGVDGFSVLVNENNYLPTTSFYVLYNSAGVNIPWNFGTSTPPNPATLLDTGTVSGIVVFQFGSPANPDIYPQPTPQPQIINQVFTLQYSVSYGSNGALSGPYATVVINQIG